MAELEDKLGAILNDPGMMQRILSMAQALSAPAPASEPVQPSAEALPDPGLLQALSGLAAGAGVDSDQKALLRALSPYVSRDRVGRLERAMRAARMAGLASQFLGQGGLSLLGGR